MKTLILLSIFLLTSCSTIIPKDSNRSFRNKLNGDIVWDKKIYRPSAFLQRFNKVDSMFLDSQETQDQIKKSNSYAKTSTILVWGGLAAALTYLFTADHYNRATYYTIFQQDFSHLYIILIKEIL